MSGGDAIDDEQSLLSKNGDDNWSPGSEECWREGYKGVGEMEGVGPVKCCVPVATCFINYDMLFTRLQVESL